MDFVPSSSFLRFVTPEVLLDRGMLASPHAAIFQAHSPRSAFCFVKISPGAIFYIYHLLPLSRNPT